MLEKPAFIQGLWGFEGQGLDKPQPLTPPAVYTVPVDKRAQTIYLRAGNSASELIYLVVTRGGKPMRYFPVGAKDAVHVPLAVLEDLSPGSSIEILLAAAEGVTGSLVLDAGFVEIA